MDKLTAEKVLVTIEGLISELFPTMVKEVLLIWGNSGMWPPQSVRLPTSLNDAFKICLTNYRALVILRTDYLMFLTKLYLID